VADVIAAALAGNGFVVSVVGWPGGQGCASDGDLLPRSRDLDVGLIVCDFDRVARIRGGLQLIVEVPGAPWIVLTGLPRGPLWGALLEIGAVHVAPATNGLDEVVALLHEVVEGGAIASAFERAELIAAWRGVLSEHHDIVERLGTMTPRETEVLQLLYAGSPVRTIAQQLDVAEATVRTQVKRVLRKLDVRSQLAAVAALEHVRRAEAAFDGAGDGADGVATTMFLGRSAWATARSRP
jgi:two-component system nitrate/nitrite response regulator NarL